jgi:hypothetical protein
MVDKFRKLSLTLESERFEAVSALEMKDDELNRVRADLESSLDARRFLEEELASVG